MFTVLNTNFVAVGIVETVESLIWTDKFSGGGDFEIYTTVDVAIASNLKVNYYIIIPESKKTMIVESIEIKSEAATGNKITIKGRALESILNRRVIPNQTILSGSFQSELKRLLMENIIAPTDQSRAIPNMRFIDSTDQVILSKTINTQFTGDNLFDAVVNCCETSDIGFEITRSLDNHLDFKLYSGIDRSYAQETTPFVIFSPQFDNLIASMYVYDTSNHKTTTYIGGEGEGSNRIVFEFPYPGDAQSGLNRKELWTDARDISSITISGPLSPEEYAEQLMFRGYFNLLSYRKREDFDGEADATRVYIYGSDFFLGDVVQIENEYGNTGRARITAITIYKDPNGLKTYPVFSSL